TLAGAFRVFSPPPSVGSFSPTSGNQGQTITNFTVTGNNFDASAALSFSGTGVTANLLGVATPTQLVATVMIAFNTTLGPRDVIVTNPDGQQAIVSSGFTVL